MKRPSTPPLNACLPRVQLNVSANEYTGELSLRFAVGFCGTLARLIGRIDSEKPPFESGVLPKSARNGTPWTFGKNAKAALPVLRFWNGPRLFVPVRRSPTRASFTRVADSVEVRLTGSTCD